MAGKSLLHVMKRKYLQSMQEKPGRKRQYHLNLPSSWLPIYETKEMVSLVKKEDEVSFARG
jgi:hypothetical protein